MAFVVEDHLPLTKGVSDPKNDAILRGVLSVSEAD